MWSLEPGSPHAPSYACIRRPAGGTPGGQLLRRAHAAQPASHEDAYTAAQRTRLLQAVRRQHHCVACSGAAHHLPQQVPGARVQARAWLVCGGGGRGGGHGCGRAGRHVVQTMHASGSCCIPRPEPHPGKPLRGFRPARWPRSGAAACRRCRRPPPAPLHLPAPPPAATAAPRRSARRRTAPAACAGPAAQKVVPSV